VNKWYVYNVVRQYCQYDNNIRYSKATCCSHIQGIASMERANGYNSICVCVCVYTCIYAFSVNAFCLCMCVCVCAFFVNAFSLIKHTHTHTHKHTHTSCSHRASRPWSEPWPSGDRVRRRRRRRRMPPATRGEGGRGGRGGRRSCRRSSGLRRRTAGALSLFPSPSLPLSLSHIYLPTYIPVSLASSLPRFLVRPLSLSRSRRRRIYIYM
jgi:hypothetical protein